MRSFLGALVLLACATPALAQGIEEGEIPPGPPFDGSTAHASMHDLESIARLAYEALAGQGLHLRQVEGRVRAALAKAGYDGTDIRVSVGEPDDGACAGSERIETRIAFAPDGQSMMVTAASGVWIAGLRLADGKTVASKAADCPAR